MSPPVDAEQHDVLAAGWGLYHTCPNFEAAFDPADPAGSARRILPLIIPNCSADPVNVEQVFGGITNTIFKFSFPQPPDRDAVRHEGGARRLVLVRIFGENGVDRGGGLGRRSGRLPDESLLVSSGRLNCIIEKSS